MSSFGGCNVKVVYDGLDKDNENSIYKLILEVQMTELKWKLNKESRMILSFTDMLSANNKTEAEELSAILTETMTILDLDLF